MNKFDEWTLFKKVIDWDEVKNELSEISLVISPVGGIVAAKENWNQDLEMRVVEPEII